MAPDDVVPETDDTPQTNIISFVIAGDRYDIDLYDLDGVEWRDMKRVTGGMTANQIARGALMGDDMEALGALLWVWRRRDEDGLTYDGVLRGLKLRDFGDVRESEAPQDPPG